MANNALRQRLIEMLAGFAQQHPGGRPFFPPVGGQRPGTFQGHPADVLSSVQPPMSNDPRVTQTISQIGPDGRPLPNSPFANGFGEGDDGSTRGPEQNQEPQNPWANFQFHPPARPPGAAPPDALRRALIQRMMANPGGLPLRVAAPYGHPLAQPSGQGIGGMRGMY